MEPTRAIIHPIFFFLKKTMLVLNINQSSFREEVEDIQARWRSLTRQTGHQRYEIMKRTAFGACCEDFPVPVVVCLSKSDCS